MQAGCKPRLSFGVLLAGYWLLALLIAMFRVSAR
jgi:hypothetical protein